MRVIMHILIAGLMLGGCDYIPGTDANYIKKSKELISADMFDPESARFRNMKVIKNGAEALIFVCGEYNGKNRHGAYVGFSKFLVNVKEGAYASDPKSNVTEDEANRASRRCESEAKGPFYTETDRELAIIYCERAMDLQDEIIAQSEFNLSHMTICASDHLDTKLNSSSDAGS